MTETYDYGRLVKKLCVGERLSKAEFEDASQYKLLGMLCMHRCAGIAYQHLLENGQLSLPNREMRTTLQTVYETGKRKEAAMRTCLCRLGTLLEKADFPYALLKGARLIDLYPSGTRTSNDIDILIDRASIPKLAGMLTENGFLQGYIRNGSFVKAKRKDIVNALLNRGETTPFIKEINLDGMKYLEIDVNISVDERSSGGAQTVKEMLSHAALDICVGEGRQLYTLDRTDFLIHLCTHLYKEASVYQWVEMGRDLSLYKFLDIYVYWKACMDEASVLLLKERAECYGAQKAVYYALCGTKQLFGISCKALDQLVGEWSGIVGDVMNMVYDPAGKCRYCYKDDFEERVFDEKRRNNLRRLPAETV